MRATSIAVVSAALLFSVSALAQNAPVRSTTSEPRGTAPAAAPAKAPQPNPLAQEDVTRIEGAAVIGSDGKKVGDVSNVLMKPDEKKIDRLVVHTGGVLGIGGRYVAMPVDAFKWDETQNAFKIDKSANDLKYMAEWKEPGKATTTATGSSEPAGKASLPSNNAGK